MIKTSQNQDGKKIEKINHFWFQELETWEPFSDNN